MRVLVVMISLLSVVISQKNLAPNGTASQISVWYWNDKDKPMTADLAVTGERTHDLLSLSCSITKPDDQLYDAWWMLTFPVDTVYITNVLIYYRGNTLHRFAGYYLYVSNSSISKTDGYLCYHHEGRVPTSAYKDVNCNYLGKQVIFYNKRDKDNIPVGYSSIAMIELCHIEVYGCYKGWWDITCSKPCPATCVDGHCYPGNGNCVWGCNPDNCLNDICDTATGVCTQGCNIGLSGDYCDKPCDSEKFGNKCAHTCHCIDQPCDPKRGACSDSGCKRGYISFNCSIECSHGSYGYNCNESCDGCLSYSCDKEHGVCTDTSGCKPGWQHGQTKCDLQCSVGSYGYNCNQSCDGCLFDSCDKEDGVCTYTTGCKPGWQYGQLKCNLPCNDGYFGMKCAQQCYCRYDTCIKITGICPIKGCQRGWRCDTCNEECSNGYHGFDCVDHCKSCNNTLCERFEGNCTYGCIEGFKGHQCLFSDTPQSAGQTTSDSTMNMVYTGVVTFIVTTLVCVIIFLAILRYRQGKICGDTKNQNEQNTRGYLNDAFTNDYANIGNNNTEQHYEETIPSAKEHTYDTL